jgi:hypothetical protein
VFNINKEPKVIPNKEQAATTDAPGTSQAGELVDYIPPKSDLKAADTVAKPNERFSKAATGRDYQR